MAPPVVVVMVAHDPGAWWTDVLSSLAMQTYANLSVLVVDTASSRDLSAELARVLPSAHLRRLESDPGYSAAANEALGSVEGAAFLLLCHDDVVFEAGRRAGDGRGGVPVQRRHRRAQGRGVGRPPAPRAGRARRRQVRGAVAARRAR